MQNIKLELVKDMLSHITPIRLSILSLSISAFMFAQEKPRPREMKTRDIKEVKLKHRNTGKQRQEQGFNINVIETKEAALQNLQTTEILNRATGIKIRQSAGLGSDLSFNLNGLSGNSIRIFIDGIPIRNYGSSFSISNIPPSMIERVEVYKGVLPAELAEDALGGGINIILKKDLNNSLTASYSFGSFNTHQADINASYRNKETGLTANLSTFYNYTDNNYKVWGDNVTLTDPQTGRVRPIKAERFHDGYQTYGIRGNVGYTRKSWADELLIGFMGSKMEKEMQTGATMNLVYGNRRTFSNSGLLSLQYRKNNIFVDGLDISTFSTYSKTMRTMVDNDGRVYNWLGEVQKDFYGNDLVNISGAEAGRKTYAENEEDNFSNRTNIHYHLDRNHLIGVNVFYDRFTRNTDDRELPNEVREMQSTRKYGKKIISMNYEGNFFNRRLKTNAFYKLYNQNVEIIDYEYRNQPTGSYLASISQKRSITNEGYGLTLSYAFSPKMMVLASAEKTMRLPGITEMLGNTSEQVNASFNLRPERGNNFNLGLHFNNIKYNNKHELGGEVNFFVRDINDLISRGVPTGRQENFAFENLGKIFSKGIDAELRYAFDKKLFINSNVSYNDARFNLKIDPITGLAYPYYKKRLRNQPYFTSNTNVEYVWNNAFQKNARLAINYNFNYTHEFFRDWEGIGVANKITIPTQALHDIGATYTFPSRKWTIGVNAKNIFNTQVFDNYALQKPGRAVYGKLTYSIF